MKAQIQPFPKAPSSSITLCTAAQGSARQLLLAGFGKRHLQRLLECEKQLAVRVWQVQGGGVQDVQGAVGSPAAARHACQ